MEEDDSEIDVDVYENENIYGNQDTVIFENLIRSGKVLK